MPVILALLGILGAVGFWYWRMRMAGRAIGEIVDVAETARGAWNRRKFRQKVEGSAISAIEDPTTGAVTMLVALVYERGPVGDEAERLIKQAMRDAMGIADPVETFTFAKWAADQAMSANDVSQRLSKLWVDKLGLRERAEFLELAGRVIAADGSPSAEQIAAVAKLKERLKLA